MNDSSFYIPGDPVVALHVRGADRQWVPGVVRSVSARSARVDLGGAGVRRVPLARMRLASR
jgi:hypothetical protein